MTLADVWEKAFDFASDSTKQLLTLATGVVALTITFLKDVLKTVPGEARLVLNVAWVMYFVSIVFGATTLLALTGTLGTRGRGRGSASATPSVYEIQVRVPSFIQVSTFLAAIVLTIAFAVMAL